MYKKKCITITKEQEDFIKKRNINLSRISQEAIDTIRGLPIDKSREKLRKNLLMIIKRLKHIYKELGKG